MIDNKTIAERLRMIADEIDKIDKDAFSKEDLLQLCESENDLMNVITKYKDVDKYIIAVRNLKKSIKNYLGIS